MLKNFRFFGPIFLTFLSANAVSVRRNFGCRDQENNPIDWWAGYKIPEIKDSPTKSISEGYGFFYLDSKNPEAWRLSSVDLNSSGQALYNTLNQLYVHKNKQDVFHLLYNDEFPNGTYSLTSGHTKGSILFDYTSGFWLIHSIPKFPPIDAYAYAENARRYGQSMLCISFPYRELKAIGNQLLFNQPSIYEYSPLSPLMSRENPELGLVLAGKTVTQPPWTSQYTMFSSGGTKFLSFAKQGPHWKKELYFDLVAPALQVSLNTETWQDGPGDLESNCNGTFNVHNIKDINLPIGVRFADHNDHSKWAVTVGNQPYVCIGDINRQFGQLHRGGGTMCLQNQALWHVYSASVADVWPCKPKQIPNGYFYYSVSDHRK